MNRMTTVQRPVGEWGSKRCLTKGGHAGQGRAAWQPAGTQAAGKQAKRAAAGPAAPELAKPASAAFTVMTLQDKADEMTSWTWCACAVPEAGGAPGACLGHALGEALQVHARGSLSAAAPAVTHLEEHHKR